MVHNMDIIILGSARCVWDDYCKVKGCGYDIMCINDIGMHYPGYIAHWYSNDADMLPKWLEARRPEYRANFGDPQLHTNNGANRAVRSGIRVWPWVAGNSGVNAVLTAIELGYENVIVCGIPLDDTGHYFSPSWVGSGYNNQQTFDDWAKIKVQYPGRVKSMSGNTKIILGE